MSASRILPPVAIVPLALFAIADWWLTSLALPTGLFTEQNPFALLLYTHAGSPGLIAGKVAMLVSLVATLLVAEEIADLRVVRVGMRLVVVGATVVQGVVSTANLFTLFG
jgi:hypothetical protein